MNCEEPLWMGQRDIKQDKWLNFGDDLIYHADCPLGNLVITQQAMRGF